MPAAPVELHQFINEIAATGYSGGTLIYWDNGVPLSITFEQKVKLGKNKPIIRVMTT